MKVSIDHDASDEKRRLNGVMKAHDLAAALLKLPNNPVLTTDGSGAMRGTIAGPYEEDDDGIVWIDLPERFGSIQEEPTQ